MKTVVNHIPFEERNQIYERLRDMPPLSHYPNRPAAFDYEDSEVIGYILDLLSDTDLPVSIRMAVGFFNRASKKKVIVYDRAAETWRGNPDWEPS